MRAATGAATEAGANWSNDSDHNTDFWQTLGASAPLAPGMRIFGSVGLLEASDPVRDATRSGGEAGLTWAVGDVELTGAAGARRLSPDTGAARTSETYRGGVSWRPVPRLGLNVSYARYPFDEIASLIERNLNLESLDAGLDATPARGLTVYGGGGGVWFSDGNHRTSAGAGVTQTIHGDLFVGVYGRTPGLRAPRGGLFLARPVSTARGPGGVQSGSRSLERAVERRPRGAADRAPRRGTERVAHRGPPGPPLGNREPARPVRRRHQQRRELDQRSLPVPERGGIAQTGSVMPVPVYLVT
jgi:hypothetical protein